MPLCSPTPLDRLYADQDYYRARVLAMQAHAERHPPDTPAHADAHRRAARYRMLLQATRAHIWLIEGQRP